MNAAYDWHGKKVLITGGTGLIGIPLANKLASSGAILKIISLDKQSPFGEDVQFIRGDLCDANVCQEAVRDTDIIFHLAGIKGGIGTGQSKASTFLVKNILTNLQIMEAARKADIERFLYASSICIYPPAQIFEEKNAFTGLPHPSDRFGGMAKMVGEMQIEAYKLQYQIDSFLTVRPANTYGPYDNFNPVSALIIPALIHRVFAGENPLTIWGDGTTVRDFVYANDVADFMILMVENNITTPLNVGSGEPTSIKTIAETVTKTAARILNRKIDIKWDTSKPTGEHYRVTSIDEAKSKLGWSPKVSLEEGIERTINWYRDNKSRQIERYSILSEE